VRDDRLKRATPKAGTDAPNARLADLRSGAAAVGPRRHSVKRGESFASISQLYYGSPRYQNALWWFNRDKIRWPEQLSAGDLLIIPAVGELERVPPRNDSPTSLGFSRRDAAPELGSTSASRVIERSAPRPASIVGAESSTASVSDRGDAQSPTAASAGGRVSAYPARPASPSGRLPVQPTRAARTPSPTPVQATTRALGRFSGSEPSQDQERTSVEFPNKTARENGEPLTSDGSTSSSRGARNAGRRSLPVHVVQPQETLRSIAGDRLGSTRRAGEIAELNQDRLAESGVLAPGQTLLLPSDARPLRMSR
jgi:nucleoid-associated protein YgaU